MVINLLCIATTAVYNFFQFGIENEGIAFSLFISPFLKEFVPAVEKLSALALKLFDFCVFIASKKSVNILFPQKTIAHVV